MNALSDCAPRIAPLRPLSVLHLLWDGHSGGTQRYVNAIANAPHWPIHTAHRIALFAAPGREIPASAPKLLNALHLTSGFAWISARRLTHLVRQHAPDVLHLHCDTPAFLHQIHRFPATTRILYTEHGDSVVRERRQFATRLLWRRAASRFNRILLNSTYSRDQFLHHHPWAADRAHVLPNPLLEPAPPRPPRRPGPFRIGCIGRLHPVKGFDRLLDAAALVDGPIEIHIYGEGDQRADLARRAADLPHDVHFHGYTDRPLHAIADLDLLVVPSRQEAFGLTALEAQAVGTPVIAHPVGGLPERITHNHNGILCDCNAPHHLATTIHSLFADPQLRNQLATEGLKTAADQSLESHLQTLQTHYQSEPECTAGTT